LDAPHDFSNYIGKKLKCFFTNITYNS
jgi:hypothetical protein